MKKLLNSDWLKAMEFKCNTGAKKCNTCPVQITHHNSGLWLAERLLIGNFLSQWIHVLCKMVTKCFAETLKNIFSFSRIRKSGFKNNLSALPSCKFFHLQFGINLLLWVFQKTEIALAEVACAISALWKTHLCKVILKWTQNHMIVTLSILSPSMPPPQYFLGI